jgi:hypothetical protein
LVWGSTAFIAVSLFFLKRGKPDNYIQHLGEYISQSSLKLAGKPDLKHKPFKQENDNGRI